MLDFCPFYIMKENGMKIKSIKYAVLLVSMGLMCLGVCPYSFSGANNAVSNQTLAAKAVSKDIYKLPGQLSTYMGTLDGKTILSWSHPYDTKGGMETYLHTMNRELINQYNVTIIQAYFTESGESAIYEEKVGKGLVLGVPIPRMINGRLNIAGAEQRLRELLQVYNIDLFAIHGLFICDAPIVRMVSQEFDDVPIVAHHHFENSWLWQEGNEDIIPMIDGVIALTDIDVPNDVKNKATTIPPSVNADLFNHNNVDSSKRLLPDDDIPNIVYPARMIAQKGHADIIEIAHMLRKRGLQFRIIFAGAVQDEHLHQQLLAMVNRYGLEHEIMFAGSYNLEQMPQLYYEADVVALASESEGFGLVLVEAQMMGTPVVTYDVGGTSNALINGKTGYLISLGDMNAFADSLETLLRDQSLRKTFSHNAYEFSQDFTSDVFAENIAQYYTGFLSMNTVKNDIMVRLEQSIPYARDSSIKGVIFDFGNVWRKFDYKRMAQYFTDIYGIDLEKAYMFLEDRHANRDNPLYKYEHGLIEEEVLAHELTQWVRHEHVLGSVSDDITISVDEVHAIFNIIWDKHDMSEMIALVKDLKEKGYVIRAVSTTNDIHYQYLLKHSEITRLLDNPSSDFYASHLQKPENIKPQRGAYLSVVRDINNTRDDAGLQPRDFLFVDDRKDNSKGASDAGLHAVCFDPSNVLASIEHIVLTLNGYERSHNEYNFLKAA